MAALASWAGGALASNSFNYVAAFNAADLNSLPATACVLSSLAPFDNTISSPDQFMDISAVCTVASTAPISGSGLSFWLALLQGNGTTLGDGRLTAGSQVLSSVYSPPWAPLPFIPSQIGTSITSVVGDSGLVTIRPKKFALIVQNNMPTAFAASGCMVYVSFYKQNLNG